MNYRDANATKRVFEQNGMQATIIPVKFIPRNNCADRHIVITPETGPLQHFGVQIVVDNRPILYTGRK